MLKDTDNFVLPITFFSADSLYERFLTISEVWASEFLRIFEPLRITEQKDKGLSYFYKSRQFRS